MLLVQMVNSKVLDWWTDVNILKMYLSESETKQYKLHKRLFQEDSSTHKKALVKVWKDKILLQFNAFLLRSFKF